MGPRHACIGRLVDSIADGEIRPMQTFAAANINNVRIRRRNRDRANRSCRLLIKQRLPRAAIVGRLPHSTVHCADVENIRLAGNAAHRARPPAAKRPDIAPLHLLQDRSVELLCGKRREVRDNKNCKAERNQDLLLQHQSITCCFSQMDRLQRRPDSSKAHAARRQCNVIYFHRSLQSRGSPI